MSELPKQEHVELIKDVFSFLGSLIRESERAAVVLAAARIDVDLERILKHVLHRHPGGTDSLFDSDRALGTFSAKIALAHRLGLIDEDFEHSLQMLRRIRNDFAHQLESESLSSTRQKPRLNELIKWVEHTDVYHSQLMLPRQRGYRWSIPSSVHVSF